MSAGHNEPQVLYTANHVRAYHVQDGQEHEITTSGPQTMSLLMVSTSSPFADLSSTQPSSAAPEEDFYLHLNLPPELDLPLPATTQIYHKPPFSYLIPRWDLGADSGVFIRLEFPPIGRGPGKISQEEVDTFETILAQCTAFLERGGPGQGHEKYNPSQYQPGQGYVGAGGREGKAGQYSDHHGQIVLIDEENGSVVGELTQGYNVVESSSINPGSKLPVEIQLPAEGQGNQITVNNVSEEYLRMAKHPAYAKSTIVQTSATASRLIVTGSNYLSRAMSSGAESFQQKTQPNPQPMTFQPATHARVRQIHNLTTSAAGLSAKTVGQVSRYAQNFGASLAGRGEKSKKGYEKDGKPDSTYKPGILNKSMMAFSTIADGIDQAGRNLLTSGSTATTNVVQHRYGKEAGDVAGSLTGGVKNVGLVYIDAAGVSRRALVKSVAKGMVVGRMPNGEQLVVGTGDGGVVPPEVVRPDGKSNNGGYSSSYAGGQQPGVNRPGYGVEGYGNATGGLPAYSPGIGEPMGSSLQGQNVREKR